MAVVVEYQAWDSASYNWLDKTTSTSAPVQINNKLDAWVAAVNANASNTNKQITVEKDPANSTSANFVGWVIKLASNSANSTTYARLHSASTTSATIGVHDTWTDSGALGGYGSFGSTNASSNTTTFYTSGKYAEFIVATETADTEEFFCLGWRTDSTSTSTGSATFLIYKDTAEEWAVYFSSDGNNYGSYYTPVNSTATRNYGVSVQVIASNFATPVLDPLMLRTSNFNYFPAAGNAVTLVSAAKSPYLLTGTSTSVGFNFGRYTALPNSRTAVCMGYSPIFVSYF